MCYRLKKSYEVAQSSYSTYWLDLIFQINSSTLLTVIDSSICVLNTDLDKIKPVGVVSRRRSSNPYYTIVWNMGASHISKIANKVNNNFLNNFK